MNSFYAAYLKFFSNVLLDKGAAWTLEEYIFSPKANIEPPKAGGEPMHMVNRFLSGVIHPLIHTGYGAEFGLFGMFVEGTFEECRLCSFKTRLTRPTSQDLLKLPFTT